MQHHLLATAEEAPAALTVVVLGGHEAAISDHKAIMNDPLDAPPLLIVTKAVLRSVRVTCGHWQPGSFTTPGVSLKTA
ncbi:hypothetical protein ACFWOT_16450 [Streptomyces sp. NPDC058440]|uniref:hypothetical protein n=1 Tax=Streptomyces sp. NPDC058440 TaxID=3346501 RepID=UPI003651EF15